MVGACVVGGMHGIRQDMVNEWVVRILLECILVFQVFVCSQGEGLILQGPDTPRTRHPLPMEPPKRAVSIRLECFLVVHDLCNFE